MDNSSRNIVNFIATVTVAALVLMAAGYYSQSRSQDGALPTGEAPQIALSETGEVTEDQIASDETSDEDQEIRASDTEVIVEDPEGISGAPSANVPEN